MLLKILCALGICSSMLLTACNDSDSDKTNSNSTTQKSLQPIIIQGALPVESGANGLKTKQLYSRNVRWLDVLERNLSGLSGDYL